VKLLAGVGFRRLAGITAALALVGVPAASAEPGSELGWLERTHLTGDSGGPRRTLTHHWVVLGACYTAGSLEGNHDTLRRNRLGWNSQAR
jgi:hypothetical protein